MNNELSQHSGFDFDEPFDNGPEESGHANPLVLVHRCLRGRYLIAIVLGLVLAAPCAVVGYMLLPPEYTSVGVINVAPTQPHILYETELNERMSSFDSFVQSQANTLRSDDVLSGAVDSESLRQAGWPRYPHGVRLLQKSLIVQVPRGSQDIFLRVSSEDPRLARAACDAVLAQYKAIAIDTEGERMQSTIDSLTALRSEADEERKSLRKQAYDKAANVGTDDLARLLDSLHEQRATLDSLAQELEIRLIPFETEQPSDAPPAEVAEGETSPSVEELALTDSELAALLGKKRQLDLELASLRSRFSPAHRRIVALNEELATVDAMIEARAALAAASAVGPSGLPLAVSSADELRRQLASVEQLRDTKRDELQRMGRVQLEIDQLREEASQYDEQFRDADERLKALRIQQQYGKLGRISIRQEASNPLAPSSDRRLPLAAMGALGGGVFGVGAVGLFGLVRPRYRYIADIDEQAQSVRIMGAIPEIKSDTEDAREMVGASVHQIRTAIDARLLGTNKRGMVHLVTSAMAGEGKSTVTVRLAKSFAITGKKTVIVDADMIGRKSTGKFNARDLPGFGDAVLDGMDPMRAVRASNEENLSILPAGSPGTLLPERVSASAAVRLLETLRESFDVVLVDTGPVLGSIEAQAIVPIADEVLLVVSRGTGVRLVRLAIDRLHRLGARRLGVVFNRATMQDLERSTSFSMTSQRVADAHDHDDFDDRPMRTADSA